MRNPNNVFNYLNTYMDVSFEKYPINEIDYLICSLLSYAHLDNIDKDLTYHEFCQLELDSNSVLYGRIMPKLLEILKLTKNCKRYAHFIVKNYTYIVDEQTQFGAMVLKNHDEGIVCFTGSDGSIIGWYENLRCAYQFPIYSQIKAKEYLNLVINDYDKITILGHSKGGNLAITSALGLSKDNIDKINHIYNFDGQGLFKHIIEGEEYKNIASKITNYIPEGSYIGTLLYHDSEIKYVKTLVRGINCHFQFNWQITDNMILEGKDLTARSKIIHNMTTAKMDRLDKKEVSIIMEKAFEGLTLDRTSKLHIGINAILEAIKLNRESELITYKEVIRILQVFLFTDKVFNNKKAE